MLDYTKISLNEYLRLKESRISPRMIADYLDKELPLRTFAETAADVSGSNDIKNELIEGLSALEPEANKDSVRRKVSNWMNGKNEPNKRLDVIKICFALKLDEPKAQRLMSLFTDGCFHMRDPEELTYLYCIRTGKSFAQANEMIRSLPKPAAEGEYREPVFTGKIRDKFENVETDAEFSDFMRDNIDVLGKMHNTAYSYFKSCMNILMMPETPDVLTIGLKNDELKKLKESKFGVEDVVTAYLRMDVDAGTDTKRLTNVQKIVRALWPSTTSVEKMLIRSEDVNRKIIMLLYVVTGGQTLTQDSGWPEDEEAFEQSAKECFENHCIALDMLLQDCGMSRLDPRNPFDQLILYSLRTTESDFAAERMRVLVNTLFDSKPETE